MAFNINQRLNGLEPLAYAGANAVQPPDFYTKPRDPNSNDSKNFYLGSIWLNTVSNAVWILVNLAGNVATWVPFGSSAIASRFQADDGNYAIPVANTLYITGNLPLSTSVAVPNSDIFSINLTNGTDGQLLIGGGVRPTWANLTSAGGTVTITNTPNGINLESAGGGGGGAVTLVGNTSFAVSLAGSVNVVGGTNIETVGDAAQTLTINATGMAGLTWIDVTGASQSMAINKGYTANRATLITLTLPATAAFGSIIYVVGKGVGGWQIAQNAGQTIHFGAVNTTTGVAGYLASTLQYDVIGLLCTVADTDFTVIQSVGDITYA